jgi:hypothetical protein
VNDECACIPGEMRSCYRGRPETEGHGACAAGTMVCNDGLEFGTWGECTGDVMPGTEACDVDESDEDCDGAANEDCECTDGDPPLACGTDVGECQAGTQTCQSGLLGPCSGSADPPPSSNNLDDDCDGQIDESSTQPCGSAVGACKQGTDLRRGLRA